MSIPPKAIYEFSATSTKIPMKFSTLTWTNKPEIYMKPQKTPKSQNNGDLNKEQDWRYHNAWFQTILKGYSNPNSIVMTQNRPMINGTE